MKKSKINFKGVAQPLINGATGAGLKMGVNFLISKIDKDGKLSVDKDGVASPIKRQLVSLAVPVLVSVFAPKVVAKPLVKAAIEGHNAITIFEILKSQIKDPETLAAVSGYNPVSVAGYNPVAMAGNRFPKVPFQEGLA